MHCFTCVSGERERERERESKLSTCLHMQEKLTWLPPLPPPQAEENHDQPCQEEETSHSSH